MSSVQKMARQHPDESLIHPREREYQAGYRAYLFGPFRVFREHFSLGEQIQRRSKAGTLLKWFLLNPGKPGSADEFLDLFWPNISAETALGNLHVTMHYLRHLLQPELQARQESQFIHRLPNNFYWFEMGKAWWADTADVQQLFETARRLDQADRRNKASFYYRKVISTCSAGFLAEDATEEWLKPYRRQFQQIHSQALQHMIQMCLQQGELEEVMEYAYQALAIDPYCEPATKAIIDVHLQEGNINLASRRLNDFWSFFQQTLGVGPSQDFHHLRDRIIEAAD